MPPIAVRRLVKPRVLAVPWLAATLLLTGATSARAFVDDDAAPEPMTPVIGVEPPNLNFSSCLDPGVDCEERIFKVFNDVQDPSSVLEVIEMTLAGAGYTLLGPSPPFTIPGDGTRIPFTVRFCPETGLPTPGAITITARIGANSPQVFTLSGDANLPPECNTGGPYEQPLGGPLVFDGRQSSDPDPDGEIVSYRWDFGDGSTGTGVQPSHTYAALGTYTVQLTVVDNCGAAASCSTTVTILPGNQPPECDTGGPYAGFNGIPIQFDGSGSSDPDGVITNYSWFFGDGSAGSGPTPSHTYVVPGTFNVTLVVTDNSGGSSTCATSAVVAVNLPPVCNAGGPYQGVAGAPVELNGSGSFDPDGVITSYRWAFGDGSTSFAGPIVSHTYAAPGIYNVTLTVRDNHGIASSCGTTATIVANQPPVCDAGGPYTAAVGAPIQFDGTGSSDPDGTIADYAWDFGDGSQGIGPAPTHSYASPGNYVVELCVRDDRNAMSCCTVTAHVFPAGNPLTPVIGVEPSLLDFGNCNGVGTPVELPIEVYNAVFDPTSILRLTDVTVTGADFELTGGPTLPVDIPGNGSRITFIVLFTAPGPQLALGQLQIVAASATNSPRVVPLQGRGNVAPLCNAGGPYNGSTNHPILFDGTGSQDPGGITLDFHWDFGDGRTGIGATTTHSYSSTGTYVVTLTVTDNCAVASSCTTTASVDAPPICNAGGPYQGSPGFPVQFDGTGSTDPDGVIVSYAWTFGDGSSGTGPTPTHTYTVQGAYIVRLTVVDDDGFSSICQTSAFIGLATPVEISFFRAAAHPRTVEVTWRFLSSGDHLGFELWRAAAGEPEMLLHDGLLADEDQDGAITFTDTRVQSGASYDYWLVAVERNGEQERFEPLHVDVPMPELALRIAPNPSRPPISLALDLPQAGPVKVWVADATGRIVRTLLDGPRPAGTHPLPWDGRDERGVAVASGIYFTILEGAGDIQREKLVLVR